MTELLALVSIVSGAAVAITVPFINARLERTRLDRQRDEARMDELRGLLDTAVQHLWTMWTTFYEVDEEAVRELPRPDWSKERLRRLGEKLTNELDVVVGDGLRVRLRTPPESPINDAHNGATELVLKTELAYRKFLESGRTDDEQPPRPPITELSEAIGRFMDEARAFVGIVGPRRPAAEGS